MNPSGTWNGHYQFESIDGAPTSLPVPIKLNITQNWPGQIRGTAIDESVGGLQAAGVVEGSARWRRIKFSWLPPVPYQIEAWGFQTLAPNKPGGSAMPIEFDGRIERAGEKALGTWKVFVWMMENDSRRKVKVIVAQGSWRIQRTP